MHLDSIQMKACKPEFRFCQKQRTAVKAYYLSWSKATPFVSTRHRFRQALCQSSKMMLAGPLLINARPQSAMAPQNIFGHFRLSPLPANQTQSLRTRSIGATLAQGVSSAIATGGPEGPFFNRLKEMATIKKKLNSKPAPITVLLGPLNCGKTVRSACLCRFLKYARSCWHGQQTSLYFARLARVQLC